MYHIMSDTVETAVDRILPEEETDEIPREFICSICHGLMCQPMTLLCQHSYCQECMRGLSSSHKCPLCNNVYPSPSEINHTLDDALRRMFPEVYSRRIERMAAITRAKGMEERIREEIYRAALPDIVRQTEGERIGSNDNRDNRANNMRPPMGPEGMNSRQIIPSNHNMIELVIPQDISPRDVNDILGGGIAYLFLSRVTGINVVSGVLCLSALYILPERVAVPMVAVAQTVMSAMSAYFCWRWSNQYKKMDAQFSRIGMRQANIGAQLPDPIQQLIGNLIMNGSIRQ